MSHQNFEPGDLVEYARSRISDHSGKDVRGAKLLVVLRHKRGEVEHIFALWFVGEPPQSSNHDIIWGTYEDAELKIIRKDFIKIPKECPKDRFKIIQWVKADPEAKEIKELLLNGPPKVKETYTDILRKYGIRK